MKSTIKLIILFHIELSSPIRSFVGSHRQRNIQYVDCRLQVIHAKLRSTCYVCKCFRRWLRGNLVEFFYSPPIIRARATSKHAPNVNPLHAAAAVYVSTDHWCISNCLVASYSVNSVLNMTVEIVKRTSGHRSTSAEVEVCCFQFIFCFHRRYLFSLPNVQINSTAVNCSLLCSAYRHCVNCWIGTSFNNVSWIRFLDVRVKSFQF